LMFSLKVLEAVVIVRFVTFKPLELKLYLSLISRKCHTTDVVHLSVEEFN
jgi:hypothetical protein